MISTLQRSHILNSWQLRHRLIASLRSDIGDLSASVQISQSSDQAINPASFTVSGLPPRHQSIQTLVVSLVRHFLSTYSLSRSDIEPLKSTLASEFPHLWQELLILSTTEPSFQLNELKSSFLDHPESITRHYLYHFKRIFFQSQASLCTYEVNPLVLPTNDIYNVTHNSQFGCYLGVSAAHLMYLYDYLLNTDLKTFNPSLQIYLGPLSLYNMFPLTPYMPDTNFTYTRIDIDHNLSSYKEQFYDDELALYSALRMSGLQGQVNVSSNNSLNSSYRYQRYSHICKNFNLANKFLTDQTIHTDVLNFFATHDNVICLHHRDSAYSTSSNLRDSSLSSYFHLIDYCINNNIAVVILSISSIDHYPESPFVLDFSRFNYGVYSQFYCLSKSKFLIGTASGISHLWTTTGISTLFLNTVALPSTHVTDSVLHSPKRLSLKSDSFPIANKSKFMQSILNSTWDDRILSYFDVSTLSPSELIQEFVDVFNPLSSNNYDQFPTAHSLWNKFFSAKPNFCDYYLTPASYRCFYELFKKIF